MGDTTHYIGFVDAGHLRAAGAQVLGAQVKDVMPDGAGLVGWLRQLGPDEIGDDRFLRAYWYDGVFDPGHRAFRTQQRFLDALAFVPGVQLRLGNIAERQPPWKKPLLRALETTAGDLGIPPLDLLKAFKGRWTWRPDRHQKGVDTRIVLDMVRLAERGAYRTGVLLAGDRDLAEAIRTVQTIGCRVVVATPFLDSVAKEVKQLADHTVQIDDADLRSMLMPRLRASAGDGPRPQSLALALALALSGAEVGGSAVE